MRITILTVKSGLIFAVTTLLAYTLYAETGTREVWHPVTPGPFTTYTANVAEEGKMHIQPLYFFNAASGTYYDDKYEKIGGKDYFYQQLLQLYTEFGITDRLEICAQPSWIWQNAREGSDTAYSEGISDTLLLARYNLMDETDWMPMITPMFMVNLPTGKYQKSKTDKLGTDITGNGAVNYTYAISLTKGLFPIRTLFHLDLLYTNTPSPVKIDGIKTIYNDIYAVNGAFEWIFYKNFNLLGELLWQNQGDLRLDGAKIPSSSQNSLILSTGIGYSKKDWQILIGYQKTLTGNNVDANNSIAATAIVIF